VIRALSATLGTLALLGAAAHLHVGHVGQGEAQGARLELVPGSARMSLQTRIATVREFDAHGRLLMQSAVAVTGCEPGPLGRVVVLDGEPATDWQPGGSNPADRLAQVVCAGMPRASMAQAEAPVEAPPRPIRF